MSLSAEFLALQTGLDMQQVKACLEASPSPLLQAYARLLAEIGAKVRVMAAEHPLRMWVANAAIDGLMLDDRWRAAVGLCRFPRNTRQTTQIMRILKERGRSYTEIALYLQKNFIPSGRRLI